MNISVIGAGSWGSSLALVLDENKHNVCLYMRREEQFEEFEKYETQRDRKSVV